MGRVMQMGKQIYSKLPKWIYVFVFVFLTSQSVGLVFETQRTAGQVESVKTWILPIMIGCGLLACPVSLLWQKFTASDKVKRVLAPSQGNRKIPFFLLWLGCTLLWLPYFLAFYPGILCYDFTRQAHQYFGMAGYNTFHPLLHTVLMGGLIDLGYRIFGNFNAGAAVYSFAQMISMSAAVSFALYRVQSYRIPRWMFWGMAAFFCLLPVFPLLSLSATKDILFSCLFLMAILALLPLMESSPKVGDMVTFACFAIALAMMRNFVLYGYFVILLYFLVRFLFSKKRTRAMVGILMMLVAIVLGTKGLNTALIKVTNSAGGSNQELLSLPAQQIMRVYANEKENLQQTDLEEIAYFIKEPENIRYEPWLADNAKAKIDAVAIGREPVRFAKLWLSLGIRHFEEYVNAVLIQNEPMWYLGNESLTRPKDCYLEIKFNTGALEDLKEDSKLPWLKDGMLNQFSNAAFLDIPVLSMLIHPAFYTWVLLGSLAVVLQKRRYQEMYIILLPLCYMIGMLLGPCVLPRYCLAVIMSTPVILAYLWHRKHTAVLYRK